MKPQTTTCHQIPSAIRCMIAAVNDLALDVTLVGHYQAYTHLHGDIDYFSWRVSTMPVGKSHTDPEAVAMNCNLSAITVPGWGGMQNQAEGEAHCREQLNAMHNHLIALLQESQGGAS